MASFSKAEEFTKGVEGGYINDPRDRGGETIFGVARKANPEWPGWQMLDEFKKAPKAFPGNAEKSAELYEKARELYRAKYCNPLGLHAVNGDRIAGAVYDFAVNAGTRRAAEILQRALNFLNRSGKTFPELLVDGNVGAKTIDAVNKLHSVGEEELVFLVFSSLRVSFYVQIAEGGGQDIFARSWLGRCGFTTKGKK